MGSEMCIRDRMKAKGDRAIGSGEEKKKPLFTKGEGAKRIKGETLWNNKGRKYFARAEAKWREIYNCQERMKVIYNKWEVWLDTKGKEIKVGDGSKKTFKSVRERGIYQRWRQNTKVTGKRREIVSTDQTGVAGV